MKIPSTALFLISGVYLTLGFMHLRFWLVERARLDYLAFTLCCFSVTLFSWGELGMMRSRTPEEFLFYAWWNFLIGVVVTLSAAWFAHIHLQGRRWLFWTYCGFRLLGAVVHLIMPNGINYREVKAISQITLLGENLSYPIAVANPWMILPHLSHILLVIFCVDASIRAYRRGERRKALILGTGIVLYRIAVSIVSIAVLWGLVSSPLLSSFPIFFVIAAMLYELNHDMHRAVMVAEKLKERGALLTETVEQLELSAAAANVGMWTRIVGGNEVWLSEKAGEIWGYTGTEPFTREDFFLGIHPDDRDRVLKASKELDEEKDEFYIEFRVVRKNGDVRWINTQGKVEQINESRIIRGAIVDVTKRRVAEEAVHDLSRQLINAQEKERARLARELHDDLSQSLALLSIQLSELRQKPADAEQVKDQIDHLSESVAELSADVHRISHELHPAKVSQLGLELALRGLCMELAAAHLLKVDFSAENVSRSLPRDVSLCLYRVAQESLQNIIKHSGASTATVSLRQTGSEIRLTVSDSGSGFDPVSVRSKESLGLISIDERVRAIKGTVNIHSKVGEGTKIKVRVRLNREIP